MNNRFILLQGPTGVGKTDIILEIARHLPIEIVNCDVGQFYEPFSIGTAKPDWKNETISHHLFDIVREPENFTVIQYREKIFETMQALWARNVIPVLVGGSGFYGKSLFFPPRGEPTVVEITQGTWQELEAADPVRASQIHPNDTYRIGRALSILKNSSYKASTIPPLFDPLAGKALVIFLTRDREELYARINARTEQMMKEGWIEEVKQLMGTPWENFLERKKLIGYTNIIEYLKVGLFTSEQKALMIAKIQQETRHYAKRQLTFWRMFKRMLQEKSDGKCPLIAEINLSKKVSGREQLKQQLENFLL